MNTTATSTTGTGTRAGACRHFPHCNATNHAHNEDRRFFFSTLCYLSVLSLVSVCRYVGCSVIGAYHHLASRFSHAIQPLGPNSVSRMRLVWHKFVANLDPCGVLCGTILCAPPVPPPPLPAPLPPCSVLMPLQLPVSVPVLSLKPNSP